MTQSELAERVGYADKGMISRVENGKIDLPQSQVEKFAQALHTTPSHLMGWEDEPSTPDETYPIETYLKEPGYNVPLMKAYANKMIELLKLASNLNDEGIDDLTKHARLMSNSDEYKKRGDDK